MSVSPHELIKMFSKAREEQLALCTTLEAIADSLPDRVDRGVCVSTAKALAPLIDHAHRMEEDILFPTLRAAGLVTADLAAALERFKIEHAGDEFFAEELVDVLLSYGAGTPTQSAEATGYMLRGFFETLRRHIASEQELLLPVMEGLNGSTNGLSH